MLLDLVHPDQCGFMPARSTRHCLRRLNIALDAQSSLTGSLSLMLLDFEKAFDTVDWGYIEQVLIRLGFGPYFRRCVRALYFEPRAQVRVNGTLSAPFYIQRGTRQGCPLSPLLFALAIEPVALRIRIDAKVRGWQIPGGSEDRIVLYADDVLLYIAEPRVTDRESLKSSKTSRWMRG